MKFFIDTANVDEIRKANDMGVICGVTTNPSLIAKEGKDYVETLKEIASIVDGPISGEVKATTTDAEGGDPGQCDADLFCKPGASGCQSRSCLRIAVLRPSGRYFPAGHRPDRDGF